MTVNGGNTILFQFKYTKRKLMEQAPSFSFLSGHLEDSIKLTESILISQWETFGLKAVYKEIIPRRY